jgi:hypothetical protein
MKDRHEGTPEEYTMRETALPIRFANRQEIAQHPYPSRLIIA